jgi:DNA-binding transcriptional LysR family regulator
MTLEDLRVLVAVAEAPSMGAVARKLGCTQPAVAQHIRRLERELETALVVRGPRGVTLTRTGEILYRRASLALRSLQVAAHEIETQQARSDETLALTASTTTTEYLLKQPILALRDSYPTLRLRMEAGTTVKERLAALHQRRVDLAFVTLAEPYRGIETRPVLEMPLRLLVRSDHPLATRRRVSLQALSQIRYIALGSSTAAQFVRQHVASQGHELAVAQTVDTPATAILYVELGLGETLVPAMQAPALTSRRSLRALAVNGLPTTPLGWASLDFSLLPQAGHQLIREVDRAARKWK